jgi:hypothetical protein
VGKCQRKRARGVRPKTKVEERDKVGQSGRRRQRGEIQGRDREREPKERQGKDIGERQRGT